MRIGGEFLARDFLSGFATQLHQFRRLPVGGDVLAILLCGSRLEALHGREGRFHGWGFEDAWAPDDHGPLIRDDRPVRACLRAYGHGAPEHPAQGRHDRYADKIWWT